MKCSIFAYGVHVPHYSPTSVYFTVEHPTTPTITITAVDAARVTKLVLHL